MHPRALHLVFHQADFGTPYPKPTRLLLATKQPPLDFMHSGLPVFDNDGFYKGPLPRHATAGRMAKRDGAPFATTGTEQWPSAFCKWIATTILDDFLNSASTADVGEPLDTEPESSGDSDGAGDKIFRFNPVTESVAESGGQLGETEQLALKYLKRGYVTGEELLDLSGKLPDETRMEGQRSFTTGAYIHQEVVGLRRNLRNHRWVSELLARMMAASFPGKVFSSLALFRDLKQPAHRDSTNGPWENLLLACTNFGAGGLWVQSEGGPAKRRILNKDVDGKVLRWKKGKIAFNAHRWHSTEDWTGTRLVLAGYTVAGLENLEAGDKKLLRSRGFALEASPAKPMEPDVDPTWPPVPGGEGPARICQEPWGSKPFHDGAGLCSPGRWDPQRRKYCCEPGWDKLRRRLEVIILDHAGGEAQLDRAPFEMAAKGELGCGLVSDPTLHQKLVEAMVEHLRLKHPNQDNLDFVDPGQPFKLRLLSALLRDALDPDWGVFLEGIEGFPVGIKRPLPRTREIFEPQTKWKLELGPMDTAQSWKANYESAEQNLDFVREHFESEVGEGLMIKMEEGDFWAKYGEEAAISAIAVIVEEGPPLKKRVVHDASHDVLLNHRIRCLDKVRSPGAREKRYLLRHLYGGSDWRQWPSRATSQKLIGDTSTGPTSGVTWAARPHPGTPPFT